MKAKTLTIHAAQGSDSAFGSVNQPIYQTSTFAFRDVDDPGPYDYSRTGNPTRTALETCLASLEGGNFAFAFASGMAAEASIFSVFGSGDHIIVHRDMYSGTHRLLTAGFARASFSFDFVDLSDLDAVRRAINANTKALWLESPTNPCMNVVNLSALGEIGRANGIITICDNTFATPYFQRPLDLGIDAVVHSTTKYLNGHSDVIGGAIVTNNQGLASKLSFLQNAIGAVPSPFDCFLVLRGIKTLAVRMEEHNRNALLLAKWLEQHPKIAEVLHPGLTAHPQHELAAHQMSGYSGIFSFRVQGGREDAFRFLKNLQLFTIAQSFGGVQSLIAHPVTMTHKWLPPNLREEMGITEDLIRISVGLEDTEDLIHDIETALASV